MGIWKGEKEERVLRRGTSGRKKEGYKKGGKGEERKVHNQKRWKE